MSKYTLFDILTDQDVTIMLTDKSVLRVHVVGVEVAANQQVLDCIVLDTPTLIALRNIERVTIDL